MICAADVVVVVRGYTNDSTQSSITSFESGITSLYPQPFDSRKGIVLSNKYVLLKSVPQNCVYDQPKIKMSVMQYRTWIQNSGFSVSTIAI